MYLRSSGSHNRTARQPRQYLQSNHLPPSVPGFDWLPERVDPPEFPESALQSRVDATVWATFEVTPRAAPDKVEIEVVSAWNNGSTLFAPAVEQTIRASKFKPECAGKTVAVVYRYELRGEAIAAPKVTQRADARVMYLESQPLLARSAPVQPTPTLAYTLPNISKSVSQIVLITTPSWTSTTGTLQRLERQSGSWIPVGRKIAVAVGSKGLGWGKGIHTDISTRTSKAQKAIAARLLEFSMWDLHLAILRNPVLT